MPAIFFAKDYTKTWVCFVHRDYPGRAPCDGQAVHLRPTLHSSCGYRYVLHQELTETAYNVLVASDAI